MDSGDRAIDARMAAAGARPQRMVVVSLAVLLAALYLGAGALIDDATDRAKRRSGNVKPAVVAAQPDGLLIAPAAHSGGFSTQVRLGFTSGDQWEPAIAADRYGHVYVLYAQYFGVPGCPECLSPTQVLTVSSDRGSTWSAPRRIQAEFEKGWDSQIAVDPVDGRTVWAAWLDKQKSDIVVARSTDFGASWTRWVVDDTNAGTDKPILAVRGTHAYVAYDHTQTNWVSYTHDDGATWRSVKTKSGGNGVLGWSLPGGGTVAPNGDVHFAWDGYEQSGNAKGPANIYVSSSRDGGATWSDRLLDVSGSPPDCSADLCGWAYLGAQPAIASDAAGTLYLLWNAGPLRPKGAPERMWFSRSTDGGTTWSAKAEVSTAAAGTNHAFPAIAAGATGDVRIAWMDDRAGGGLWNTYYRSSTNGGASWSAEHDVSTFASGMPSYITSGGFEYPFGDYFEIDIDDEGTTHVINGQGLNYDSPGSIWYTRGE